MFGKLRKSVILSIFLIFPYTKEFGQNLKQSNKIDPELRTLILKQKSDLQKNGDRTFKKKVGTAKTGKAKVTSKKFECIIYTKDAGALKDRGISINSILPTFVTAIITVEQIEQLAAMPEVNYIEAAKAVNRN